jgi:hypothetical protein
MMFRQERGALMAADGFRLADKGGVISPHAASPSAQSSS